MDLKLLFKLAKHFSSEILKGTPIYKTEFTRALLVVVGWVSQELSLKPLSLSHQLEDNVSHVCLVDQRHQNHLDFKNAEAGVPVQPAELDSPGGGAWESGFRYSLQVILKHRGAHASIITTYLFSRLLPRENPSRVVSGVSTALH